MAQTMDKIMAGARLIIASATPDVDPVIPFVSAPMNGELESLPFAKPSDATRKFHVISGVLAGAQGPQPGNWNANEMNHLADIIVVRVRYHCPLRGGGYLRLSDYLATDAQRIYSALANATKPEWGGFESCPQTIDPSGGTRITPVGGGENVDSFILNYPFRVQMILGATE